MDYSLALELKIVGFPQYGKNRDIDGNLVFIRMSRKYGSILEEVYIPTLEDIIEACGDGLKLLINCGNHWQTQGLEKEHECRGSTPLEAVARLWLALNEK